MSPVSLVSIIVPAFITSGQQIDLLRETLATVFGQTCDRFEVILVDDGSPLPVTAVVEPHPKVTFLRRENGGSALARNAGIAVSRGEYLLFLDADDHLLPVAIETGLERFAQHPECGFIVGPHEEMTFEGEPVGWTVVPPPAESQVYESLLAFDWYIIPPSSAMFRRSLVGRIGGFRDPWGADDLDFYLRAARASSACCYQSPAVTRYRRYSTSSSRNGERMLHSIRAVYERQRQFVEGHPRLEAAFDRGLKRLTDIFIDCLVENVQDRQRAGDWEGATRAVAVLDRERQSGRW
ncbi:MAG TPA: glycosyltransferase family A protein [Vicinamibacterales bacterium]